MPNSDHSWLVIRAIDELDQICMLQEFVDMVVEQLDKQPSRNRELKIELLLQAYQNTAEFHLVALRDRLKDIHRALAPDAPSTDSDYLGTNSSNGEVSTSPSCH